MLLQGKWEDTFHLMYATFTEGIGEKVATVATESLSIVHGIPHIY